MRYPSHIFKAYDIRGLSESELSVELAYNLGKAFVQFLRETNVNLIDRYLVVGRDMRETSPLFSTEVIRGINDEGVGVVDIGEATTPLFNFACANYKEYAGGIMVTASHNPAEYNGFKMTLENGLPIGKNNGMSRIYELVCTGDSESGLSKENIVKKDVLPDYLDKVFSIVSLDKVKPLKVVIDFGNGMGIVTFEKLISRLPIKVEYLYEKPDGNFPNHEANPLKTDTLNFLRKKVVETGADFGFALDGDADRIGLVDEKGEAVDPSFVGALIGLEVLKTHPNSLCLYDLRSSQIAKEVWEQNGAKTKMCMVGHALIKKMMKEIGARFASELSLHLYYNDMYDVESSDLSFLYILQVLSRENKKLSELVKPLKKYFHSGEINFEVENKAETIKRIEEKFKNDALEVSNLDGLWLKFPWGWFNVRESNTEPILRLNLEAVSQKTMEEKVQELRDIIQS